MATTVFSDVDPGDCKVHTGIPSNSLRCTFSPNVVNHGGLSLSSSGAAKLTALCAPKSFPTTPTTRNTPTENWCTNEGSPVHGSSAAGALGCGSPLSTDMSAT